VPRFSFLLTTWPYARLKRMVMTIKVKLCLLGNLQHYGKQTGDTQIIPFEDYVKGVVAAEIGNAPLEACKAQAVAARTFACNSDVISDSGSSAQVFFAARITNRTDYPSALQGVEETAGEILIYQERTIGSNAHYSSSNNGTTKSGGLPYLVNRFDEWTTAELERRKASGEKIRFGHGEGLSQYGAMYAARQGIGYREILAFYYPGTMIGKEAMLNDEKILAFLHEQVGKPYKDRGSGPASWDCSGLTQVAVRLLGFIWYHGATTQWLRGLGIIDDKCKDLPTWLGYWADSGPIDTLPIDKLAFLFHQDDARKDKLVMAHTGIYDGRGMVIQAGGQYPGVSDKPLNKGRWSHWATLKGVDVMSYDVNVVQQLLIKLGYDLGTWGADGKQGAKTTEAIRKFQTDHKLAVTGVWTDAEQAVVGAVVPALLPTTGDSDDITITLSKSLATALKTALDKVV